MKTLVCGKCGTAENLKATVDYGSRSVEFCEQCFAELWSPATDEEFYARRDDCENTEPEEEAGP